MELGLQIKPCSEPRANPKNKLYSESPMKHNKLKVLLFIILRVNSSKLFTKSFYFYSEYLRLAAESLKLNQVKSNLDLNLFKITESRE